MRVACAVLLAGVIAGLGGCAHSARHVDLPTAGPAYEKEFLKWLVTYHQEQDRMTQPCVQNDSIRQVLRNFCVDADRQHTERLERLRSWLSNWYQTELPKPEPYPLWLGSLKGQEFEREFLREYLQQHDEGIEQTARCVSRAVHPELRELCARVNPVQKTTGEQLKRWRCAWFKQCG